MTTNLQVLRTNCGSHEEAVFLPLLFIERGLEKRNNRLWTSDNKLNDLEEQMGQHETPLRPKGDLTTIDFSATMVRINNIIKLLALDRAYMSCLMYSLGTVLAWKDKWTSYRPESDLDNRVRFAEDSCRLFLVKVDYEKKRAKMLIQVVHSPFPFPAPLC